MNRRFCLRRQIRHHCLRHRRRLHQRQSYFHHHRQRHTCGLRRHLTRTSGHHHHLHRHRLRLRRHRHDGESIHQQCQASSKSRRYTRQLGVQANEIFGCLHHRRRRLHLLLRRRRRCGKRRTDIQRRRRRKVRRREEERRKSSWCHSTTKQSGRRSTRGGATRTWTSLLNLQRYQSTGRDQPQNSHRHLRLNRHRLLHHHRLRRHPLQYFIICFHQGRARARRRRTLFPPQPHRRLLRRHISGELPLSDP